MNRVLSKCTEPIRCTFKHPFYVRGKGWTAAEELLPGDELRTPEGSWAKAEGVADAGQVEPVYNFQVENDHTYFVSVADGAAVLVHNDSGGPTTRPTTQPVTIPTTWRGREWNLTQKQFKAFTFASTVASKDFLHPMAARYIWNWLTGDGGDLKMLPSEIEIVRSTVAFKYVRGEVLAYLGKISAGPYDLSNAASPGWVRYAKPSNPLDRSPDTDAFFAFGTLDTINWRFRGVIARNGTHVTITGSITWDVSDSYAFKDREWEAVAGTDLNDSVFWQLQEMGVGKAFKEVGTWTETLNQELGK